MTMRQVRRQGKRKTSGSSVGLRVGGWEVGGLGVGVSSFDQVCGNAPTEIDHLQNSVDGLCVCVCVCVCVQCGWPVRVWGFSILVSGFDLRLRVGLMVSGLRVCKDTGLTINPKQFLNTNTGHLRLI